MSLATESVGGSNSFSQGPAASRFPGQRNSNQSVGCDLWPACLKASPIRLYIISMVLLWQITVNFYGHIFVSIKFILCLPVQDFLGWRGCRISLRKHGDDNVGTKSLVLKDLVHNLLSYLTWNCVVAVGGIVFQPTIG